MLRSLFMTLIALLTAACVQVGVAPSGSPAAPSTSLGATSPAETPSAPSVSAPPTIVPGTSEPTRTRRPRPQRTDRPTRPPIQPSEQPSAEPPTAPPTEPPSADLVIEALTAPQSVESGSEITISFTVRNVGQAPSGQFANSYDVGGGGGPTLDGLPALPAGGSVAVEQDLGEADYVNEVVTVQVVVDSRDDVAESDETNNEGSVQVQVVCADDPLCP